ncbi:MAG: prepilin peptidase [Patescibacteria group bacterium]|nr:prepilin peptidase [Patescibacteria group bacterium]
MPSIIFYLFAFALGLATGSFIHAVSWRLGKGMPFALERSVCFNCGCRLRWFENIPVFSFLFLRGRCGSCEQKIPWRYLLAEIVIGAFFVFAAWRNLGAETENYFGAARDVFFVVILASVFLCDYLYGVILPEIVWPALLVGFLFNYFIFDFSFLSLGFGILAGGGFFLAQYVVSRGKWIGGGDVRLGTMMGAWLGWPNILAALFFAYLSGAVAGLFLLAFKKKNLRAEIPFGTFLAAGTLFVAFLGNDLINWYRGLIGF